VCTGHCTVQCSVHRQPRASNLFPCALSGGSPDSYCVLSGVHRTGTVDCPVHPYRVLKNGLQPETELEALFSLCAFCSLFSADLLPLAGDLPSPASTILRRPRPSAPLLPSLGEQPLLPLSSLSLYFSRQCTPYFHPLCPIQNPMNSSESMWCNVFLCGH
jgi:hypothetical protein